MTKGKEKHNAQKAPVFMKDATETEIARCIMDSPIFQMSMDQSHHFDTTLGRHSIQVKKTAVKIGNFLERVGIEMDVRCIVTASLCHDLGMVERDKKYRNNRQCCREHPAESVREARKLIPDLDMKTEEAILAHMWPLTGHWPSSPEGWIVLAADKYVSTVGTIRHLLHIL